MKIFNSMHTFDQVIKADKSHTNGFDYLRIGLAIAVLCVHVVSIADRDAWTLLWTTWFAPFELTILPSFFALSGFLVAGSLFRNSIPQFLALRVVRIFPALAVEVVLSAIVLGAFASTLSFDEYVKAPEFRMYFLNVIGWIHYSLPGVFEGRAVNTQLWTIPFELECYIALVALFLLGFVRRKGLLLLLLGAVIFGLTAYSVYFSTYTTNWNVPGRMLVFAFLFGVLGYLYKNTIVHSKLLFLACALATYVFLSFPNLVFLAALPIAYITIYIGLLRLPRVPFGDLSYGVYLFHFPIARTIHEMTGRSMSWTLLLVLTVLLSGAFAAVSWTLIEKPILDKKKQVLDWVASVSNWTSAKVFRRA